SNPSHVSNVIYTHQSKNEIHSQDTNGSHGFSAEQLRQIAQAVSLFTQNNSFASNSDSYANAAGLSLFHNVSINSAFTRPWILDSGAIDHITSDSTFFTQTKSPSIPIVNLPNGSPVSIHSTGTIPFNSVNTLNHDLATGKMIGSDDNLANPNQLVQNPTSDETLESVPVTLEDVVPSSPLLRQFARLKKTLEWHKDYILLAQANQSSAMPSPTLADIIGHTEPSSYAQAVLDPHWRQDMNAELEALKDNKTWSLVPHPVGQKPIGCKWV
ncbi:hypothetical protein KY284_031794, partial [Solanum tuberosum]